MRVTRSELKPGDRFILVYMPTMRTATALPDKNGLVASTALCDAKQIRRISEETSVFTFEESTDDWFSLHEEDEGYLTTEDNGKSLTFSKEKTELCDWDMDSDGHLYIPLLHEDNDGRMPTLAYGERFRKFCLTTESPSDILTYELGIYRIQGTREEEADDGKGYRVSVFETSDIHGYIADMQS